MNLRSEISGEGTDPSRQPGLEGQQDGLFEAVAGPPDPLAEQCDEFHRHPRLALEIGQEIISTDNEKFVHTHRIEWKSQIVAGLSAPHEGGRRLDRWRLSCRRHPVLRIKTDSLIVIGNSAFEITLVHANGGAVDVTERFIRLETHDHVVISDRALCRVCLGLKGKGAIVVGFVIRAEVDCGANDADPMGKLTAERMRFSITFSSLFAGHPHISEIAIARPILRVPLLRQRSNSTGNEARSENGHSVSAKDFPVDRVTIEDGTVVLSGARDHLESRIKAIVLTASLSGRDGPPGFRAQGQWVIRHFGFRAKRIGQPTPGRETVTVQCAFEAPGLLQDSLSGMSNIKVAGSTVTLNGLNGTIAPLREVASAKGANQGRISVDSPRPLPKPET